MIPGKISRIVILCSFLLLGSSASSFGQRVTRGPYLQLGTPRSVIVKWRTNVATSARVRYGPNPTSLLWHEDQTGTSTEHTVTLRGLTPQTKYYYSVGTAANTLVTANSEQFFITSPVPGRSVPTRIWVLGDSGTADSDAAAVRDAYFRFSGNTPTNLWLMLGDNAYHRATDAAYQSAVFDMFPTILRKSVLWPTLGNHDGISANSSTQSGPYYSIFTLPRRGEAGGLASGTEAYYSFDYGNIHFICLESFETNRATNGPMLTWLARDLAATSATWVIAFWHHPPYSKGKEDSDAEIEQIQMRQNALPILEAYGVDLVLGGHSHSYERSFLIDGHYGASTTFNPLHVKDGGNGRPRGSNASGAYVKPTQGPAAHEGTVYAVAGSAGQVSGGPLNHPAMFISFKVLGSMVIDISRNRLDARFLDRAGRIRDSFTIIKGTR
jgi:hypothetical protein